ncbi:hypothetical protein [Paenibacillus nasutitermitis]|uniref:Uncharacterized protein n=1 Tax=Paenibacillus nasutitermitis TaxID=1652958 RepID=A0A916Z9F2_9BACL|nr:hypothetical protein [Paenibacillus nasutitermitis]GGD82287.1 hypothetical protein GCM10010911_45500 [Paenibacillus nasutitermitis]
MNMEQFLSNRPFAEYLDSLWDGERGYYRQSDGAAAGTSVSMLAAVYHLYSALLADGETERARHVERLSGLMSSVLPLVREDGGVAESADHPGSSYHPGLAFNICKCLGLIYPYLEQIGLGAQREPVRQAIVTMVEHHPEAGEAGTHGSDQSLRFELAAYYFAYVATGERKYLGWYKRLFHNGIASYTRDIHSHKERHYTTAPGLQRAGLHPDFTFNYAGGIGTETELPTNAHTPAYYLAEVDGFLFTYLLGLKNGVLTRNADWDDFCRKYARGLYKDLSRAGRMSCDVDGYGIHRAWYAKVIFEGLPLAACVPLGPNESDAEARAHFKWYCDRYLENFMSSEHFRRFGVPPHQPYGHRLTIEKQFDKFNCIEIYAKTAAYLYEFGVDREPAREPDPFYAYSWWHDWLRVSTPVYETSFAAATGGCAIPKARHFGDSNLGTLAGGAALMTLFAGKQLLYAPSTDPDYAFDMLVMDRNGRTARSSCTLFGDRREFYVENTLGERLEKESFVPYGMPFVEALGESVKTVFRKSTEQPNVTFVVQNRFSRDNIEITQKFFSPAGCFIRKGCFNLPLPKLEPVEVELRDGGSLTLDFEADGWLDIRRVRAFRCRVGAGAYRIELLRVPAYAHERNTRIWRGSEGLEGEPGGENSFSPHPTGVLRIGAGGGDLHQAELVLRLEFMA